MMMKRKYDDTRVSRRGCGIAGYVAKEKVFVDGRMRLSMKAGRVVVMGIIFESGRVLFRYVIVVAASRCSQHRRP